MKELLIRMKKDRASARSSGWKSGLMSRSALGNDCCSSIPNLFIAFEDKLRISDFYPHLSVGESVRFGSVTLLLSSAESMPVSRNQSQRRTLARYAAYWSPKMRVSFPSSNGIMTKLKMQKKMTVHT